MAYYNLLTNYNITIEIGTEFTPGQSEQPGTWTYTPLGAGINNIEEALNETVNQYFFLIDAGFGSNYVVGMAPTFTLTGVRVMGDAAQEYIFSQKYNLNEDRRSSIKITYTDNSGESANTITITCDCTIANIQEFGGATNDGAAISFELRFDGEPERTSSGAA